MDYEIRVKHYQLPLKHPFSISRYTVQVQDTVVVSISDGVNTGYGEATVNPYYNSTVEQLKTAIESVRKIIRLHLGEHPQLFWQNVKEHLGYNNFALCAVDCAYWDYYARTHGRTLRSYWNTGDHEKPPKTNYTIGLDELAVMANKIRMQPWPIYKIKLGVENDVGIVEALRKTTDAIFRIDANCAWDVEETIRNSQALSHLGVEFIEQPLPAENWKGMDIVKQKSALPIIADESCITLDDVENCAKGFHGINIKLMKCGGITPALKMIELARGLGLKVMAGCMTESTIGISNLVQLASQLDYLDADGAMLLSKDIAEGVRFENGSIIYANTNGSGTKLL